MSRYVWLCPKPDSPSGGVQFIHRWASLLDSGGIDSSVLQVKPFEVWWDTSLPKYRRAFGVTQGDTVIIPEVMWHEWRSKYPTNRAICLMQNWVWMDDRLNWKGVETITCSRYLANYAKRELKMNVLGIVRPYLDSDSYSGKTVKRNKGRVLLVERRSNLPNLREMITQAGFSVDVVSEPINRRDLLDRMLGAEYYAHTVTPEGFPQICLEAMRSKTLVVGTSGGGGNEFMFDGLNCIVTQDPVHAPISDAEFCQQIVEGIVSLSKSTETKEKMVERAYDWSMRYGSGASFRELNEVIQ